MPKETLKLADFTEEKKAELRQKYGEIYDIVVEDKSTKLNPYQAPDPDEAEVVGKTIFIRKPKDHELNFALAKMPQLFEAGKVLVTSCYLGGDEEVLNTPSMFNSAAMYAVELIEVHKGRLKKA